MTNDMTMLVADSDLLGEQSAEPIRPFRKIQETPPEAWTAQTPRVYFSGGIADYRPGVDDILVPEQHEDCAVVVRQANFVFARRQGAPRRVVEAVPRPDPAGWRRHLLNVP